MKSTNIVLFILAFFTFQVLIAQTISISNIKADITYLASDKLEGRAPGTKGEKLAIKYISDKFKKIGLKPKGSKGYLQNFDYRFNTNPHDTTGGSYVKKTGTNVIGFLDNGASSTIVIGGHFDHLGNGHNVSALDTVKTVHNGADDNASGTAGVIELANYFANNKIKEKNNFLFICFSAEEDGLVGSKHFTQEPTLSLDKVNFMINMDMIGRLDKETKKLLVYGVGTSPQFAGLIDTMDKRFHFVLDSSGVGPTDHTSFYLKDIPVLSFFTGQHSDYHKATDDVDKINFDGEKQILEYIVQVVLKLDKKGKLHFTPTKQKMEEKSRAKYKVSLGIMPDYTAEVTGLRIDAVTEGRPAQVAGIEAGDVIIEMDGKTIKDIYGYMDVLAKYKSGDTAVVKVKRAEQMLEYTVKF